MVFLCFSRMICAQMYSRKNVRPIEHAAIYTIVTRYLDVNDVEERPDSVCNTFILEKHSRNAWSMLTMCIKP